MRDVLIHFLDRIKEYEHESGHSMHEDERDSSEIVDIHIEKYPEFKNNGALADVIGIFMSDTIYIIPPYNNHVRFFNLHPNIPNSRAIIEFLKGNDKDPDGDFIVSFQADCKIDGDKLKCIRSDYGQKWESSIDINTIKVDKNFL